LGYHLKIAGNGIHLSFIFSGREEFFGPGIDERLAGLKYNHHNARASELLGEVVEIRRLMGKLCITLLVAKKEMSRYGKDVDKKAGFNAMVETV